jgi:tetratricopeptide (TPR) repeat protein
MMVSKQMSRGATWMAGLVLATATLSGQTGGGRGTQVTEAARVQQVRVAIGHGQLADARRLAAAIPTTAGRDLASALVDVFEGKDDAARAKLEPLARVNPVGDAALELGLLEWRHGQRDESFQRLNPIASVRTFAGPDDYHRLGRAARGIREFLLADDAYRETADVPRADIQTARGDLYFQRFRPGDAVTDYRKALEIDPQWVPAMLGLARALADEAPDEAEAAMAAARKLAPSHPDLWLLTAELQIEREDKAGAAESLDRFAAARPGTVEEAALRALLAYAVNDTAGMSAALARVTAIDRWSALGYRRLGEQAARDYRFDEAAEFARQATKTDPDDPYAHFNLGLYLMRTGDEAAARVALDRSWALDKSAPVTKNLLDVLDRIDAFETVTSGDLIFKFARDEAAVLRTYAVPLAEEAMKTFSSRYGFTPQGPIVIEIFPRHDDFAVRTMGLPGLVGALGACFGRVIAMDSPSARDPGIFSWQATLWHELAHVYTLQLSQYRVPRWLTEGISVFEEHRKEPAWGRELALEFASELSRGRTFGVKKLPEAFKRPESLALAYFEASLLAEHLVALNGDQGLRSLLSAYAGGAKDADAFTKAFGRSVDDVEASFRKFVDERYGALGRAMADPPTRVAPDDLTGLRARAEQAPGNFASQHAFGMALIKAGDGLAARVPLERAAELAPQASGSASPRAVLADIAARAGDSARARRELRLLLTHDHTNIVAARKLLEVSGDAPEASDDRDFALRLVADLDPFDAQAHMLLGRRLFAKAEYAPALLEFRASLAMGPPNLAEAHTDLGETLFKLGRKEEARRQILLALQQAPTYARAQDVLLAILGRN